MSDNDEIAGEPDLSENKEAILLRALGAANARVAALEAELSRKTAMLERFAKVIVKEVPREKLVATHPELAARYKRETSGKEYAGGVDGS
jgi:hypothetical protein